MQAKVDINHQKFNRVKTTCAIIDGIWLGASIFFIAILIKYF